MAGGCRHQDCLEAMSPKSVKRHKKKLYQRNYRARRGGQDNEEPAPASSVLAVDATIAVDGNSDMEVDNPVDADIEGPPSAVVDRDASRRAASRLSSQRYRAAMKARSTASRTAIIEGSLPGSIARAKYQAGKMWDLFKESNRDFVLGHQALILEYFLRLPQLTDLPGMDVLRPKHVRTLEVAFQTLRHNLQDVKEAKRIDHRQCRNAVLNCLVGPDTQAQRLVRSTAEVLGIQARNIRRVVQSRMLASTTDASFLWCGEKRRRRADALSEDCMKNVLEYWASETSVSSNTKDCRYRMVKDRGEWSKRPIQYLQTTQTEFYLGFKKLHPEHVIGQRSFELLKPSYIRAVKDIERNVCCCKYHVEMLLLKDAVNAMRGKDSTTHPPGKCSCLCTHICHPNGVDGDCQARQMGTYTTLRSLWGELLCEKGEDEWHSIRCIKGECASCGILNLKVCPMEDEHPLPSAHVQWKKFGYETLKDTTNAKGEPIKRLKLQYKKTQPSMLISELRSKVMPFLLHNYVMRWQDTQFKKCLLKLPPDTVLLTIDFSENYTCQPQNEIQSMHWTQHQVTILVHIMWWRVRVSDADIQEGNNGIRKCYHFYVSDDSSRNHDSLFVQHAFSLNWGWMQSMDIHPKMHWVWSDGCAAQFKGARAFYHVARYPSITGGCKMIWSFFASGHGKGEHDGAGAVLKSELRMEERKGARKLLCASDVVEFLTEKISIGAMSSFPSRQERSKKVKRRFWLIRKDDVNRRTRYGCKTVAETQRLHSVMGWSADDSCALKVRDFTCFCDACISGEWGFCAHADRVQPWTALTLEPLVETEELEPIDPLVGAMAFEEGDSPDLLSEAVEVGDNFAVPANEEGGKVREFFLLKCTAVKYTLLDPMEDPWNAGETWDTGTTLIEGHFYSQYSKSPQLYHLLDDRKPGVIESHLVRYVKFPMEVTNRNSQNKPIYRLPHIAYDVCRQACEQWADFDGTA